MRRHALPMHDQMPAGALLAGASGAALPERAHGWSGLEPGGVLVAALLERAHVNGERTEMSADELDLAAEQGVDTVQPG
jgi:hypothetical protein